MIFKCICILCLNAGFVCMYVTKLEAQCVWRQPNYARLIWWRDGQMVTKPAIDVIQALWNRPASTTSLAWLTVDRNHSLTHSEDSINTTVHFRTPHFVLLLQYCPYFISLSRFFVIFSLLFDLIVYLAFFIALFVFLFLSAVFLFRSFFHITFLSHLFLSASHSVSFLFPFSFVDHFLFWFLYLT